MKRLVPVLTMVLLGAAGLMVWLTFGGCGGAPRTRIAERVTYDGPVSLPAVAEDWPRWLGPRGDGISRETNLADRWPDGGPPPLWSAEVGVGFASPVAAGGVVYLFTLNDGAETLTAFDAASGKIRWSRDQRGGWDSSYPGTRATPAIDGGQIYTFGATGNLVCRDLDSGLPRWTTSVTREARTKNPGWGNASTPLVDGDLVYVQAGVGGPIAVAVRKADGSVAWKSQAVGAGGYAHPILIDVEGTRQLVVFGGEAVVGMDPATGETRWSHRWPTGYNVNGSTPVYRDGHLFVTSAYGQGCTMLRVTASGVTALWKNTNIESRFQPTILDGDFLYANSEGTLTCMSWPDGAIRWRAKDKRLRLGNGGSFVRTGERLVTLSERGKLSLARATPDGATLLSQAQVLDGRYVWATPLLYGGRLYAKGDQEFICFDVSAGTPAVMQPTPASSAAAETE